MDAKNTVCTMEKFISQCTFRSTGMKFRGQSGKKKKKENFIAGQKEYRRVVARVNLCDEVATRLSFNPLIPTSDKDLISPYNISPKSQVKVTRVKEIITK